jgi:hypothetical protein
VDIKRGFISKKTFFVDIKRGFISKKTFFVDIKKGFTSKKTFFEDIKRGFTSKKTFFEDIKRGFITPFLRVYNSKFCMPKSTFSIIVGSLKVFVVIIGTRVLTRFKSTKIRIKSTKI